MSVFVSNSIVKEIILWFTIGSVLGAIICVTIFVLAAVTPGLGGASGLARSVGKFLDSFLTHSSSSSSNSNDVRSNLIIMGNPNSSLSNGIRPIRRSYELL